jgi:hypothetical protein
MRVIMTLVQQQFNGQPKFMVVGFFSHLSNPGPNTDVFDSNIGPQNTGPFTVCPTDNLVANLGSHNAGPFTVLFAAGV